MKVIISEACDGFTIILKTDATGGERVYRYWFDQEDTKESLVEVFNKLGIEAEYEEDY